MIEQPLFHLNLSMRGCLVRATLNGFPVLTMDARRAVSFAPPINAFLVGKENKLLIEVMVPPGSPVSPRDIQVAGTVSAYAKGGIVAPDAVGQVIQVVDVRRALLAKQPVFPLHVPFVFDNEGPGFPALFQESEEISDPEPLLDYAMYLKGLATIADADGLAGAFEAKVRDYATAYYGDPVAMMAELAEFFAESIFPGPLDLKFERTDIRPVPWCGGRVWELRRGAGEPLFATRRDEAGGRFAIPVYVAKVGGALKVVR